MKKSNKFQEMLFLNDNTQKIIKYLMKLGYNYIGSHPEYSCHCIYTDFKQDKAGNEKPYYGFCNEGDIYNLHLSEERHDCGQNTRLFMALAALRKDDNDYYQWFADDIGHFMFNDTDKMDPNYLWHKMDTEELIRHFADMEPATVKPSTALDLQQTIACLEEFGYVDYTGSIKDENTINSIFIFKDNHNRTYYYKLYGEDEFYPRQHDREMKKLIDPHIRIINCGKNVRAFLALAALRPDTDKFQYFKLDDNSVTINGACFLKDTIFMNHQPKLNSLFHAHKILSGEIISHFIGRKGNLSIDLK